MRLRVTRPSLLLLSALILAGCATPPAGPGADRVPSGPVDPFAVKSAALIWPGASSAILATDSALRVSAGTRALTWQGRCAGEAMPVGRFGRPTPGSPNILWRAEGEQAVWRMELAPVPVAADARTDLIASIELTCEPRGAGPVSVELVATLSPDSAFPIPAREREVSPVLAWSKGRASTLMALGPAEAFGPELRLTATATRAQPRRWRFLFSALPLAYEQLRAAAGTAHASCMASADREWAAMLAPASRLRVGDATLEQAVDEALLVLVGCSERVAKESRPIGNPFQYRDTWIRDASCQASALIQWGLREPAREAAAALLVFEDRDGLFQSQSGQLDGMGHALWALEEVHARDPDVRVSAEVASAVQRAWRWCESRRAFIRDRAPELAGLMPPADPRDNELAAGYLFGTDAWTLAGYRSGAWLVERAGNRALADSLRHSAEEYSSALLAHIARRGGGVPSRWDGAARDWGNFSALFPTRAIPLETARRARLLTAIEQDGPAAGLARCGSEDSVHLYLGADLAVDALLLGRPELWRSTLASTLAARTGTGGLPEVYCLSTRAYGWNLPPHTTAAAALLTLARQGLVFDAFGDTLRLTLGTLPEWWRSGGRLERTPTRWGPMDLAFQRSGDRVSWRWSPVPVWTELGLPPGARRDLATSSDLPGSETRILVPPGRDHAEVRCRFD